MILPDAEVAVDGCTGCRLPEAGCSSTPAGGGIRTEAGITEAGALCTTETKTYTKNNQKNKQTNININMSMNVTSRLRATPSVGGECNDVRGQLPK